MNTLREFKSLDSEVWRVRLDESDAFLVIKDEKRRSELTDYPWFSEHEASLFESKENVIQVSYLVTPDVRLSPEHLAEVFEVVEQLLHHVAQASCDIILTPHTFPSESDRLNYIQKMCAVDSDAYNDLTQ
ncbi:hypothetical protein EVJ33_05010 [Exiguobacterium sp. SL-10]|uniref:hypothetical protein n=1 Tax=Exiguobacterium sp. SL-10 TaxID=2510962 RepID=UPI00103CA849|nr:hypothetical protein [Exiguobacterium sp. SL-10]TCI30659.1 hypothetical protein EVJ33_05010 [Exiguobacterium sp. SL-10]